jgi:hypothetical protein
MTDFTGGITMAIEDTPASGTYTVIPGLVTPPSVGKTNPLVDVTDFDSAAKEYIGGLPDGNEISATFHYDAAAATNTQLVQLQTAVNAKTNVNIQVVVTDGTNSDTFTFAVVPLSWAINGGPEDVATMEFSLKISGAITQT